MIWPKGKGIQVAVHCLHQVLTPDRIKVFDRCGAGTVRCWSYSYVVEWELDIVLVGT